MENETIECNVRSYVLSGITSSKDDLTEGKPAFNLVEAFLSFTLWKRNNTK